MKKIIIESLKSGKFDFSLYKFDGDSLMSKPHILDMKHFEIEEVEKRVNKINQIDFSYPLNEWVKKSHVDVKLIKILHIRHNVFLWSYICVDFISKENDPEMSSLLRQQSYTGCIKFAIECKRLTQ